MNKDLMTAAIQKAGTISPAHDGRITLIWNWRQTPLPMIYAGVSTPAWTATSPSRSTRSFWRLIWPSICGIRRTDPKYSN